MRKYGQLTEAGRYQIYALRKAGHQQVEIAQIITVHPSTISREVRRNTGQRGYRPRQAHQKALRRRHQAAKKSKMTPELTTVIEAQVQKEWSPEQISGWLKKTHPVSVSHQRIYQHIQADRQQGGTLHQHLRQAKKKRRKRYGRSDSRGQIKDRISIEERPEIVDQKSRIGDWEIDTVIGKNHRGALITLVERFSRYTLIAKANSRHAEEVAQKTISLLAPVESLVHTVTADNGKEFAQHKAIGNTLGASIYFAHPYHAWERGLNENTNGLIRQYFPKGSSLENVSQQQIQRVMNRLNHRPRKGLAFSTPAQLFQQALDKLNPSSLYCTS